MHHSTCRPFSFGQETVFFVSVHYGKRSGVIIAERIYHLAKSFFVVVAVKRDNVGYLHSALGYRTCFIKAENVNSCKGFHAVQILRKRFVRCKSDNAYRKHHTCHKHKTLGYHTDYSRNRVYNGIGERVVCKKHFLTEHQQYHRYNAYGNHLQYIVYACEHL